MEEEDIQDTVKMSKSSVNTPNLHNYIPPKGWRWSDGTLKMWRWVERLELWIFRKYGREKGWKWVRQRYKIMR